MTTNNNTPETISRPFCVKPSIYNMVKFEDFVPYGYHLTSDPREEQEPGVPEGIWFMERPAGLSPMKENFITDSTREVELYTDDWGIPQGFSSKEAYNDIMNTARRKLGKDYSLSDTQGVIMNQQGISIDKVESWWYTLTNNRDLRIWVDQREETQLLSRACKVYTLSSADPERIYGVLVVDEERRVMEGYSTVVGGLRSLIDDNVVYAEDYSFYGSVGDQVRLGYAPTDPNRTVYLGW